MSIRLAAAVLVAGLALVGCRDTALGASGDGSANASADSSASSGTASHTMPDVVGRRLSTARQTLRADGFENVGLHDATGRDRPVLVAKNWIVRSQTPAPGTRGDARTRITLAVSKPTDGVGPTRATAGVVPNVVCKDLQGAQDTLQEAGFDNLGSQDGTGQGRAQLIDRNWVVTAQSVRPGSRPAASTRIVLTAVKFGEPTGKSGCRS